ncbi:MAG: flagellin, partial [Pseudomonadales bacterium]
MALVVNTNVASITSQMYVNQTNKDMADTMARLSSGKRINTAADDAAGVAIASRLTSEVRGINQAVRNALDAQAMIDTGEGALVEAVGILQRMRELAV